MSDEIPHPVSEQLAEELRNFEEIARHVKPEPGHIPAIDGIDIAGFSQPLHGSVGGDHILYIDFNRRYDLSSRIAIARNAGKDDVADQLKKLKRRAGILVADVSGHRTTDAVIAAMLHQAFLLGVLYELDIYGEVTARLFEHINTRFHLTTAFHKYFTMIYGEIATDGKFRFISAGHAPPAIFSREFGRFMRISPDRLTSFPPVGMLPSSVDPDDRVNPSIYGYKKRYQVNEINLLAPGDILLLHTDGLSEHADGRFFSEGVEPLLTEARGCDAAEISARLQDALADWGPQNDDVSVVVIRKTL